MSKYATLKVIMIYQRPQCQNIFLNLFCLKAFFKIGLEISSQSGLETFHVKDKFRNKTAFNL